MGQRESARRARLLQGATALLYSGPLLAGLAGYGWAAVPVFAAIFGLWVVSLRPSLWPGRGMSPVPLLSKLAVQVLLVAVSFGVGRGLGGVAGVVPSFVAVLPVALSFLALPLARMVFTTAPEPLTAEAMVAVLGDQPADLPDPELQARLAAMARVVPAPALRDALDRAAAEPGAPLVLRRARAMPPAA